MARGRRGRGVSPVLVIHGGAGTMSKARSTPEDRELYRIGLRTALEAGYAILRSGGDAMDAAVAAVTTLEDNPLFNAGKGAVFNVAGKNELECSIMLSKPPASHPEIDPARRGMALMLLTHIRNPSKAARALYLRPSLVPHATLSGPTAESIAGSIGEELVESSYYYTEARWRQHRKGLGLPYAEKSVESNLDLSPKGTVGAVCLDSWGCIATSTSTGGFTNKQIGRDTPTYGAGYWAEEWTPSAWLHRIWGWLFGRRRRAVGVSGTGNGDYFLRLASASTVVARMKYANESLETASANVVQDLKAHGGEGGLIAVDDQGNVSMPLNCSGMYRGLIRADGKPRVAIFHDDTLE